MPNNNKEKEALKYDTGKPAFDLLPWSAIEEVAAVMTYGAGKYDRHNWRKGFEYSRLYAAAFRHLVASIEGTDDDPESGLDHLAHACCCILFLLEHKHEGYGNDDRIKHNK